MGEGWAVGGVATHWANKRPPWLRGREGGAGGWVWDEHSAGLSWEGLESLWKSPSRALEEERAGKFPRQPGVRRGDDGEARAEANRGPTAVVREGRGGAGLRQQAIHSNTRPSPCFSDRSTDKNCPEPRWSGA